MSKSVNKIKKIVKKVDPLRGGDVILDKLGVPSMLGDNYAIMDMMTPDTSAMEEANRLLAQSLNKGESVNDWGGIYKAYASEKSTLQSEMTNALSREKAVMAAGGLQADSEGWNQRLNLISNEYGKKITGLQSGSTFTSLQKYYTDQKGTGDVEAWLKNKFPDIATVATRDASKAGDTAATAEKVGNGAQMAAAMSEEEKRKTNVNPWLA